MNLEKMDNLAVITGRVSMGPIWCPGDWGGSIDFELKHSSGPYQVVARDNDIVKRRDEISGRVRVFGELSSRSGDTLIIAHRVEVL